MAERDDRPGGEGNSHRVRPRWVWLGVLLALVGAVTLGVGIAVESWWVSGIGVVVGLVGTGSAAAGGVMYDAGGHMSPREEGREVLRGGTRPGIAPGDTVPGEEAHRDAVETDARTARTVGRAAPRGVPLAPAAGWLLVLAAAVLVLTQQGTIGQTTSGHVYAVRDETVAVVLGLAGLRIATAAGRPLVALGTVVLAGVVLLLSPVLADHESRALAVLDGTLGVLSLLVVAASLLRPRRAPQVR